MSLFQAIVLGGLYWLSYCGFGCHGLNLMVLQPLPLSVLVGLVLGDVPTAMIVGATIQPMYLSQTQAGWVITQDTSAAGVITAAVVITSGMDIKSAMAVAVTAGVLLSQLTNVRMTVGSVWNHLTDKYIAEEKYEKTWLSSVVFPSLFKIILYWLPMTLILYFGASSLGTLINGLPEWLLNGLSAVGSLMPILGMCIVASTINKRGFFPFFIAGFFAVAFTDLSPIGIALLGLFVAYLYFFVTNKGEGLAVDFAAAGRELPDRKVSKKELDLATLRLLFFYTAGNSFERYQANGVVTTMFPILKKLYKEDPAGMKEAMERTSELFNAEDMTGALPIGIAISMEEQKAGGAPIEGELITETKAALFPPMAALGDTLNWATIVPIVLALMCPYAMTGAWWHGVVAVLICMVLCNSEAFFLMRFGYNVGTKAVKQLTESGLIDKILSFFTVLGLFVIGGMTCSLVHVATPIEIATESSVVSLQADLLDALVPNLLTFIATMIVYRILKKGKASVIAVILGMVVVGIVCGALGILI